MISLKCLEPPIVEPIQLEEAKSFLKIEEDVTYHDRTLTEAIKASRCAIETFTGRALICQTWRMSVLLNDPVDSTWWDGVKIGAHFHKTGKLRLPKPPLIQIKMVEVNGQELAPLHWKLFGQYLQIEPITADQELQITFVTGYGRNPADIPGELKQAVLMYTKLLFESQGENPTALGAIRTLIQRYRVLDI